MSRSLDLSSRCGIAPSMRIALSLFLSVALWTLVPAPASAASKTWAVFDSQRAMEATKHFKSAKSALQKELKSRQTKLEARQSKLKERRDALEAKKAVSASDGLVDEERKLVEAEQKLTQAAMRSRQELGLYERKLKEQIFARMEVAVQEVATKFDHEFVIEKGKVLYNKTALDITKKVIKVYKTRFGDKPLDLSMVDMSKARGPRR